METESIEAITGIGAVDEFLAKLPQAWAAGRIDPNPQLFAFGSDGEVQFVNAVTPEQMSDDDVMNVKANTYITYIKSAHPVAVIMLSEAFQMVLDRAQETPSRVDCNRFERDADYRREVLQQRAEVLVACVQTPQAEWSVRWPITRDEANKKSLGRREPDVRGMAGGTMQNLFHKAHAQDVIVESVPDALRERAPFAGKSIEELRPSVPSMLKELDPKTSEGHMLDVLPDLRLILGLFGPDLSVMALNFGARRPISELRARILETLSGLLNESILEAHIRQTTKGYIHYGALALRIGWK
jgi:hypothetical protein